MDFYKALAEAVGDDGLRRLGVTSEGSVVSNFNQKKLIEMSLAADAFLDSELPAPGGENMIPAWAVTHMGDEPELREAAEVKAPSKVLMALVGSSNEDLGAARKRLEKMVGDLKSMQGRGVKDPVGVITSKFSDAISAADKKVIADYLKSMIEAGASKLPARFKDFQVYADRPDMKYTLYHLPMSLAKDDEPRFLRVYPNGKWELLHSKNMNADVVTAGELPESDAEDAGIELGIDEQDGTMVPAALFNGNVYYWTGDGFSEDREEGMAFTDADEADAELVKVEEFINAQMEESDATDFATLLSELKGNPWHDKSTGKFSNKGAINRAGRGSLSLRGDKRSKQKVKGSGKEGPKMVKTPNICGRAARKQGLNVRCWTGTPFPGDYGKTPKELTSKGMQTKNIGAGRGWRKGQTDRAVGRKLRGEWVDVDVKDVLFELDLTESDTPSWTLIIEDKAAAVQQHGENDFVWEAYWIDGGGETQIIATGDAETVEEAWSDAAVGMGLEFTEASMERNLDKSKPVVISGVKGMKSKPATKKFKNYAAYEAWLDKEDSEAADWTIQRVYNESDIGEEAECGCKAGPRWRKNPQPMIDRLRSLGA